MKLFISHTRSDRDIATATSLAISLQELGHEVEHVSSFNRRSEYGLIQSKEALGRSQALVVLLSDAPGGSQKIPLFEAGYFLGKVPDPLLISVMIDSGAAIPLDIALYPVIFPKEQNTTQIAAQISDELIHLAAKTVYDREAAKIRKAEVERSADAYIAQSLSALNKRETNYKRLAYTGYFFGYMTILSGLGLTLYRVAHSSLSLGDIPAAIYTGVLTVSAIGFLAAASKYAFVLGRSFMVEALRTNDRTHAIKFGEFYLKTFGDKTTWNELKEAFQYWNLDTGSSFKEQKEQEVDPQTIKSLVSLIETLKK